MVVGEVGLGVGESVKLLFSSYLYINHLLMRFETKIAGVAWRAPQGKVPQGRPDTPAAGKQTPCSLAADVIGVRCCTLPSSHGLLCSVRNGVQWCRRGTPVLPGTSCPCQPLTFPLLHTCTRRPQPAPVLCSVLCFDLCTLAS